MIFKGGGRLKINFHENSHPLRLCLQQKSWRNVFKLNAAQDKLCLYSLKYLQF